MIIDTHCHIHSEDYSLDADEVRKSAHESDVKKLICVGTDVADSKRAIAFTRERDDCFASVGLHPHDAKRGEEELPELADIVIEDSVVAVGECGLDYYYSHSPPKEQEEAFRLQVELAMKHDLPLIFHVRDAFEDFWRILDDYKEIRGVVHSFTSNIENLQHALERNLYVAFNGIMTFTKQSWQLEAMRNAPLESVLLETDTPFLTPAPYRGKVNSPKNVRIVAEFLASEREESFEEIVDKTTTNAENLFGI